MHQFSSGTLRLWYVWGRWCVHDWPPSRPVDTASLGCFPCNQYYTHLQFTDGGFNCGLCYYYYYHWERSPEISCVLSWGPGLVGLFVAFTLVSFALIILSHNFDCGFYFYLFVYFFSMSSPWILERLWGPFEHCTVDFTETVSQSTSCFTVSLNPVTIHYAVDRAHIDIFITWLAWTRRSG